MTIPYRAPSTSPFKRRISCAIRYYIATLIERARNGGT